MLEEQRRQEGEYGEYDAVRRQRDADEDGRGRRGRREPAPVAYTPLELAADARYHATGKRKSAIARVILKPGEGTYTVNGRHLDEYFPRVRLQRMARQPLEAAGYDTRMDVVARIHGGGVSAQANALRHGIARALVEADPALRARAQAPRLPHARPAREGAQEGRAQEGPQAAAVLEALDKPSWRLFGTDGVRGVAGEFLTADLALALGARGHAHLAGASTPQVLIVRDTRESGEMLEAALAAGIAAGGGHALLGGVLPTPGRVPARAPLRLRPGGRGLGLAQPVPRQRHQVLRPRGHEARGRDRGGVESASERLRGAASDARSAGVARAARRRGRLPARARAALQATWTSTGSRILLDCANGATYRVAPEIFRRLGADVDAHRRRAGRPQHQRRVRLDARRPRSPSGSRRPRRGLRLRRRRRPRAGGRPQRRRSWTATS